MSYSSNFYYSSKNNNIIPAESPKIVFECSDISRDRDLLLLKRKKDSKFELHLHNDYINQAIAMVLEINDLAKMFDALEEYLSERTDKVMKSSRFFTIDLTKTELDLIQKQFLEEFDKILDKIRQEVENGLET